MTLWLFAFVFVALSGCFFGFHSYGAAAATSALGWGLVVFGTARAILRWVGRQFRGDYKRG